MTKSITVIHIKLTMSTSIVILEEVYILRESKMFFHVFLMIGGGVVVTHVVILIRKLSTTIDSVDRLVKDTNHTMVQLNQGVGKLVTRYSDMAGDADVLITQVTPLLLETTKDADILMRKLQEATDNWIAVCEAVELVPLRRKVKEIACLPFTLCYRQEEPTPVPQPKTYRSHPFLSR
jgi:hypothetical protein